MVSFEISVFVEWRYFGPDFSSQIRSISWVEAWLSFRVIKENDRCRTVP